MGLPGPHFVFYESFLYWWAVLLVSGFNDQARCTAPGSRKLMLKPKIPRGAGWCFHPSGSALLLLDWQPFTPRQERQVTHSASVQKCDPSSVISHEVTDQGLLRCHGNVGEKSKLSPGTNISKNLTMPLSSNFLLLPRTLYRNIRKCKAMLAGRGGHTFKKQRYPKRFHLSNCFRCSLTQK